MATMACRTTGVPLTHSFTRFGASGSIAFGDGARKADAKDGIGSWPWKGAFPFRVRGLFSHGRRREPMTVTLGKSRVRESRTPGSVRAKPNGRATRPAPRLLCWPRRKTPERWRHGPSAGPRSFKDGRGEMHRQLTATRTALQVNRAARNRHQLAQARHDMRTWQVERRKRTRHLIELGGLVVRPRSSTRPAMIVPPSSVPCSGWLISSKAINANRRERCGPQRGNKRSRRTRQHTSEQCILLFARVSALRLS